MTPTKEPLLIYELKNTIFSVYRRHELTQKWKEFEFNVRGFNQQNNLCEVHSLGESMVAEEEGEEGDHGHQPRQLSIHLEKMRLWMSSL